MGYFGKPIAEKWADFVADICGRIFVANELTYFILQRCYHQPIIECLLHQGFIMKSGTLTQCCNRLSIKLEEREADPIKSRFSGKAAVYLILKPLSEFDWLWLSKPKQCVVLFDLISDPVGPFSDPAQAADFLVRLGYVKKIDEKWQKGIKVVQIRLIRSPRNYKGITDKMRHE